MEEIIKKIKTGAWLTKEESAKAGAYFYTKFQASKVDREVVSLAFSFLPELNHTTEQLHALLERMQGLSQAEWATMLEKYHVLSGTHLLNKVFTLAGDDSYATIAENLIELQNIFAKNPDFGVYLMRHADQVDITGDYSVLRNSIEKLGHTASMQILDTIMKQEADIHLADGLLPTEKARSIVHAIGQLNRNILQGYFDGSVPKFSASENLNLLRSYGALSGIRADENNLLDFQLTNINLPAESYAYKRSVIDKTLTHLISPKSLKSCTFLTPPKQGAGALQAAYEQFAQLTNAQKIDYLSTVAEAYCRYAGLDPVDDMVILREDSTTKAAHYNRGTKEAPAAFIKFNLDALSKVYSDPVQNYAYLMDATFHELDHHINDVWRKRAEYNMERGISNSSDFKQRTGEIMVATDPYVTAYAEEQRHDLLPCEKSANLIGNGYVFPKVVQIIAPDAKHITIPIGSADARAQYAQEFQATDLGTGLTPIPAKPGHGARRHK